MSGSAAKESRREVRKAFGDQAAQTLERQGAHLTGLGTLQQFERERTDYLEKEVKRLGEELRRFQQRTWRARLRWIFRGQ